jgi:hypothetical protein
VFHAKALRREGHKAQRRTTQPFAPFAFPFLAPLRETANLLSQIKRIDILNGKAGEVLAND